MNKPVTFDLDTRTVTFSLDGKTVTARPDETIWQVAKREGTTIPHLCHKDATGYRPDGNCRACMVEIDGDRVLAASCVRKPTEGMVVKSASERATKARAMVMEMLVADQPVRAEAHDRSSHFWDMADAQGVTESRFPRRDPDRVPLLDDSHVAMRVNLDACIHCNLCVRACREVQVNDVIGMAARGFDAEIVFDFNDPMGASTCVACGECVQACPTGALMEATVLDDAQQGDSKDFDREVASVCPFCGVGCQLSFKVKDEKIKFVDGLERPGQREPPLRQGPLRLRLHPPPPPPDQAADPPRRRAVEGAQRRSGESVDAFPRGRMGRGDQGRRRRSSRPAQLLGRARGGGLRLCQMLQ